MIEAVAEAAGHDVSRETFARLSNYVDLLLAENQRQNLIARSTEAEVWHRHIVDSAQLVRFAIRPGGHWLDIGSGPGLPGLVIAVLTGAPATLVEPRRLRAEFLAAAVGHLGLAARVSVIRANIEKVSGRFDTITARAFAAVERIFEVTPPLCHGETQFILPRGQNGKSELAEAARTWQGSFAVEASLTDPNAVILLASGVSRRGGG